MPRTETEFGEMFFHRGRFGDAPATAVLRSKVMPDMRASYAMALIERFALVAGEPDGEDSAGRQRLRLPTAEALVARACAISTAAFDAFASNGWLVDVPTQSEIEDLAREKDGKN